MITVEVLKISYFPSNKNYSVILKELDGNRCLPIIVGTLEAQSIALVLESVETPRPLTHDLICALILEIDSCLKAVRITDLQDGVFLSHLEIESESFGNRKIDARPSDAIAIALKLRAPILVSQKIFLQASVKEKSLIEDKPKEKILNISLKKLKMRLNIAIKDEEYEIAAKLRDKISNLEQEN